MADQTEKPKLGTRPPLGLKRTVETGKVKQSFSHGRSNTVVVEVKKRRILGRPGEAPPAPAPEPVAEAPKPAPKPVAPAPAAPPARRLSEAEQIAQRRADLERMQREAEEERLRLAQEARQREDRSKVEQNEEERRRA
jgi:translation initiation factor IF-2